MALKISNQIPNTDWLVSFGFATFQMLMGLEFLNLIGQANLPSSYIVIRDKLPPSNEIVTSYNLEARLPIDSYEWEYCWVRTFVTSCSAAESDSFLKLNFCTLSDMSD
jgi:hypothetical protein